MKIYVISDTTEFGVAASNYINRNGHVAILSEVISDDQKAMLSELRSNVGGSFDVILMICQNAKDVAISANKMGGAMAVVCKDEDDALEAMSSTRANVILIDSSRLSRSSMNSILSGLLSEQEAEAPAPSKQKAREVVEEPAGPGIAQRTGSFFSGIKNAAGNATSGMKKPAAPAPRQKVQMKREPRGEGFVSSTKKKGLFGSIKDSLGIIDDDKK